MTSGPRERLIYSTIELVRTRGVEGAGIKELLEHSGTARRSIYQHFPGGKAELVVASINAAGAWIRRGLRDLSASGDPAFVIRTIVDQTQRDLVDNDYRLGCPVAAAAGTTPATPEILDASATVFESWTKELAAALERTGHAPAEARSRAGFAVSAIEGALLRARCARSPEPLEQAARHLNEILAPDET